MWKKLHTTCVIVVSNVGPWTFLCSAPSLSQILVSDHIFFNIHCSVYKSPKFSITNSIPGIGLLLLMFSSAAHHRARVHHEFSQKNIVMMRDEYGVRRELNINNSREDSSALTGGSCTRKSRQF